MNRSNSVIYLPHDADRQDCWDMVAASLRSAGFTDIRPAPMPSIDFQPRHARPVMSIVISSVEA